MEYIQVKNVKKPVSKIIFGTAMAPYNEGGENDALLDEMIKMGVTTLDTARVYGQSEDALGRYMDKRGNREDLVLLSKCGHYDLTTHADRVNEKEMNADLATALEKLKTNYIDIYILHRDDPKVPAGEVVEIFNAMHAAGKIGAFGGSNWTHERIEAANEYAYAHNMEPFSISSPHYGLARQVTDLWGGGCVTLTGEENASARAWYEKTRMPVVAYSSLARGLFSGRIKSTDEARIGELLDEVTVYGYAYPENFKRLARAEEMAGEKGCTVAQIAMAYMFNQKMEVCAVVSTSSPSRMLQNIRSLEITLTEQELNYLNLEA